MEFISAPDCRLHTCAFSKLKKLLNVAALWFGLILLTGNAVAAPTAREIPAAKPIQPAAVYHNYCSVCHGDRGDGRSRARGSLVPPPRDFTTPEADKQFTRDYMVAVTRDGKPGTAMAGWKTQINQAEIEAVVDHIRTVFMVPEPNSPLGRGRKIYMETCSVCHGDRGQGAMWAGGNLAKPPRAFTPHDSKTELTLERIMAAVTHGVPGTAMASFATQLKKTDIEEVSAYVRKVFVEPGIADISGTRAHGGKRAEDKPAPAVDMTLPLPKKLVGNVDRGRRFYEASCATCHGVKGDGQGPRAYFIRPKPANFLDPVTRSTLNRPAIFAATAAGKPATEMPAWDKVINDQQIADVAEYVFRAFVHHPEKTRASAASK